MAAVSVLTLKDPIVPLVCSFDYDDLTTVRVDHKWTLGAAGNTTNHDAKMYLPTANDPSEKELLLYVIDQYLDACHNDRLHISTGPERYSKFRAVLQGDFRITWQTLSDAQANKTLATFAADLEEFIAIYFAPSSADDQMEYLRSATKPYSMTCEALGARLRVISRLCKRLPGADATPLIAEGTPMKRAYFALMPQAWRIKFVEAGQVLDVDTYTFVHLVRFMAVQEALSKRSANRSRDGSGRGGRGGRGSSSNRRRRDDGGRGSGRGRGRGRGSYGNYHNYRNNQSSNQPGRGFPGQGIVTPPYYSPQYRSPQGRFGSGNSSFRTPSTGGRSQGGRYNQPAYGRGRGPVPYVPNFHVENQPRNQSSEAYYGEPPDSSQYYYNPATMGTNQSASVYTTGPPAASNQNNPPDDHYYYHEHQQYQDQYYEESQPEEDSTDNFLSEFGL